MKKTSLIIIAVLFISLMFTSGCVSKDDEEVDKVIKTNNGVSAEFLEGAPPDNLGEADDFDISIQMTNKGEHAVPVGDAVIHILGINPRSFQNFGEINEDKNNNKKLDDKEDVDEDGVLDTKEVLTFKANSIEIPPTQILNDEEIPGGIDILTWEKVVNIVDMTADQDIKLVAQTCYNYVTKAKARACFNENPYLQTTGAETCKVQGEKDVTNTGAPIKVSEVVEYPAGKEKFRFIIKVSNEGSGVVYSHEIAPDKCTDRSLMQTKNLDKVYVDKVSVGNTDFTDSCSPREIRLTNGEGQFTCSIDLTGKFTVSEYEDFLRMDLKYGYYEQAMKEVTLKAIPGVDASA